MRNVLGKCQKNGCNPVIQVRGEMGPGDYKLWGPPTGAEAIADYHETGGENYYLYVDINDENRYDIRVACKKCGVATGWAKRDAPNMPDAGLDWSIKLWNETHKEV